MSLRARSTGRRSPVGPWRVADDRVERKPRRLCRCRARRSWWPPVHRDRRSAQRRPVPRRGRRAYRRWPSSPGRDRRWCLGRSGSLSDGLRRRMSGHAPARCGCGRRRLPVAAARLRDRSGRRGTYKEPPPQRRSPRPRAPSPSHPPLARNRVAGLGTGEPGGTANSV